MDIKISPECDNGYHLACEGKWKSSDDLRLHMCPCKGPEKVVEGACHDNHLMLIEVAATLAPASLVDCE